MRILFLAAIVFGVSIHAFAAATYYVTPSGNDSAAGAIATPWKTINKANNTLQAGDLVIVSAGTYAESINPKNAGTSPVNRITYRAKAGAVVLITGGNSSPVTISGASPYVTVDGFSLKKAVVPLDYSYNVILEGRFSELRNCKIEDKSGVEATGKHSQWEEVGVFVNAADILVENNLIDHMLHCGIEFNFGTKRSIIRGNTIQGSYLDNIRIPTSYGEIRGLLIENNILSGSHISDGVQTNGNLSQSDSLKAIDTSSCGIIIRNNIIFGNGENGIDLKGSSNILVEGNTVYGGRGDNDGDQVFNTGTGSVNDRGAGVAITHGSGQDSKNVIVRNNIVYDNLGGIRAFRDWFVFNNTIVGNNRDFTGSNSTFLDPFQPTFAGLSGGGTRSIIKNNIVGDHQHIEISTTGTSFEINGNLYFNSDSVPHFIKAVVSNPWQPLSFTAYLASWAGLGGVVGKEANSLVANPKFVSVPRRPLMGATFNFHLQASSPAIDQGVRLTSTVGAGSGTSVTVGDSRYFMDGYGITSGDTIKIGAAMAVIKAINHSTNVLTLDRSVAWVNQAAVNLPFSGTAPDIGALEYTGSTAAEGVQGSSEVAFRVAPNPFRSSATLRFFGAAPSTVTVYDLRGRQVAVLGVSQGQSVFEAKDAKGGALAPGIYTALFNMGKRSKSLKLFLSR